MACSARSSAAMTQPPATLSAEGGRDEGGARGRGGANVEGREGGKRASRKEVEKWEGRRGSRRRGTEGGGEELLGKPKLQPPPPSTAGCCKAARGDLGGAGEAGEVGRCGVSGVSGLENSRGGGAGAEKGGCSRPIHPPSPKGPCGHLVPSHTYRPTLPVSD